MGWLIWVLLALVVHLALAALLPMLFDIYLEGRWARRERNQDD